MFYITASKLIKEQCKSFKNEMLSNFMHDITFANGQISMLMSNEKIFLFYYRNKIPTLCTDETGRTLPSGIYLNRTLEKSRKDCGILMPLLVKIGKQFGHNYGKNSIHIVTREDDCQHLYSLFFDLNEDDFLHWIVNNGNFLNDFISEYNYSAKDLILEAKAQENRIILPTSKQIAQNLHFDVTEKNQQLKLIHKSLHLPIYLSPQQSSCLVLLMQGKSAKKIALTMKLSHRTIEHYLEKIKKQLGCSTTKELIAFYRNQIMNE